MSRQITLLVLAALMLVSPAPIRTWEWADSTLKAVHLPPNVHALLPTMQADFDGDGTPEALSLADGRARLRNEVQIRWESLESWQVRQASIADLNRDGLPEVVLLVWRPFKPWPVDSWLPHGGRIEAFHDSAGRSCQIILIGWYQGAFRERWAGSALAQPVSRFAAADLSGNGIQLLVTLESEYDDPPFAPARRLKTWEWNGFGFTLVSNMEGPFSRMAVVQAENGQALILTP
jgi:hypothetical protein